MILDNVTVDPLLWDFLYPRRNVLRQIQNLVSGDRSRQREYRSYQVLSFSPTSSPRRVIRWVIGWSSYKREIGPLKLETTKPLETRVLPLRRCSSVVLPRRDQTFYSDSGPVKPEVYNNLIRPFFPLLHSFLSIRPTSLTRTTGYPLTQRCVPIFPPDTDLGSKRLHGDQEGRSYHFQLPFDASLVFCPHPSSSPFLLFLSLWNRYFKVSKVVYFLGVVDFKTDSRSYCALTEGRLPSVSIFDVGITG